MGERVAQNGTDISACIIESGTNLWDIKIIWRISASLGKSDF